MTFNTSHGLPDLKEWTSSEEYQQTALLISTEKFIEVSNLLLENPNLNSTHLFRADILFDSCGILRTTAEKESSCCSSVNLQQMVRNGLHKQETDPFGSQGALNGITPYRTVIRRLIPRNTNLDQPLEQTCLFYNLSDGSHAVVYIPNIQQEQDMPWYHPPVKALAYLFEDEPDPVWPAAPLGTLSIHFLPLNNTPEMIPPRLHRTFISLLTTFIRLGKLSGPPQSSIVTPTSDGSTPTPATRSTAPSTLKDSILPQHTVQNTYSRLKTTYAPTLISRWVESTEPSKHIFEDLSIAAFLIELWKSMYGGQDAFPGFVDIACGNGVLVWVLIQEGWKGWGFDARRRKTWDVLDIDNHLQESICIPKPFLGALDLTTETALQDSKVHDGMFDKGTFIVSNHADELTPWTPLLAVLSCPEAPLPFLAIPCCSHALSGVRKRYTLKDLAPAPTLTPALATKYSHSIPTNTNGTGLGTNELTNNTANNTSTNSNTLTDEKEPQPANGDLKSLRAQKLKEATHQTDKSMYACLTKKVVALAEEVGYGDHGEEVEMTLMRIPSTRNIGVVGGRRRKRAGRKIGLRGDGGWVNTALDTEKEEIVRGDLEGVSLHGLAGQTHECDEASPRHSHSHSTVNGDDDRRQSTVLQRVQAVIERECAFTDGIQASAKTWIERAQGLQRGKGRGKVNLRCGLEGAGAAARIHEGTA